MEIELTVRDAVPTDLTELTWTGGESHLQAIVVDMGAALAGDLAQLVVELPNGRLVAFGAVHLRKQPGAAMIMMLSVHETLQSLGLGSFLIAALEERARTEGLGLARIGVEHDNPRAAALYRRLGYVEVGDEVDHWSEGHGRTYVTVCTVLEKALD